MVMERIVEMESGYDGPIAVARFRFGGVETRLVRPTDPDRLLTSPNVLALNRRDDYMPYWAYLWPGAFLLAEAAAREVWPSRTSALELGCGLGLAGLTGLHAGLARVEFTDYDSTPLGFVAQSGVENGFGGERLGTSRLDWRSPPDARYPVILGADVLYEHRLIPLVANVLAAMLQPGGQALLSSPYRAATEDLDACLAARGLRAAAEPIEARDEHARAIVGTIYRVRFTSP